jgi:hypothetical protein
MPLDDCANGRSSCGGSETSSWRSCVTKTKWRRLMKPPVSAWAKQSAGQCAKAVPSFRMATGRNHGVDLSNALCAAPTSLERLWGTRRFGRSR